MRVVMSLVIFAIAWSTTDAWGAEFTGGHMFVTSSGDHRIYELDAQGELVRTIGAGSSLSSPRGLAFGPDGNLYVSSFLGNTILVFDADGDVVSSISDLALMVGPHHLAFGPGGRLYVCSASTSSVVAFNPQGVAIQEFLPATLPAATGVAVGSNGHIYQAGGVGLTEFDPSGIELHSRFLDIFSANSFTGVAFGPGGLLYASVDESGDEEVRLYKDSLVTVGQTAFAFGDLTTPRGIAFGPNGNLFVVDVGVVKEFTPGIAGTKVADHGVGIGLMNPYGVAFAPYSFAATITGTVARNGEGTKKVKEKKARLQVFPGAVEMSLLLIDSPTSDNDLASIFGDDPILFRGYEAAESSDASKRVVQCVEIPSESLSEGLASLHLELKGPKPNKGGVSAGISSVSGTLLRASPAGVFSGKVTAKKPLK